MKKFYKEGIANQIGPESCAWRATDTGEALTGGCVGWVLSFEKIRNPSVDLLGSWGRQHGPVCYRKDRFDSAESEAPRMRCNLTRGNREILQAVRGDYRTSLENSREVRLWRK